MNVNDHRGPDVDLADLRADAEVWRGRGTALAELATTIRGIALGSDRLGIFAPMGHTHTGLAEQLSRQCAASSVAAERLSTDLAQAADAYERVEEESARGIDKTGQQIERDN